MEVWEYGRIKTWERGRKYKRRKKKKRKRGRNIYSSYMKLCSYRTL
jgi:hypothetical protein